MSFEQLNHQFSKPSINGCIEQNTAAVDESQQHP